MSANIFAISAGDVRYPTALAAIHDPPADALGQRRVDALRAPSVAIVGSRRASPYALEVARRLGADLARRHVTVVSGMARGVDSAAHRGALEGGGVDRRGVRLRRRRHLSARASRARRAHLRARRARQRVRSRHASFEVTTFRSAIASSAGSRWRSWSSRRQKGAVRSSPPTSRSSRGAPCLQCRATCSEGGTSARTRSCATVQSSSSVRTISWRRSLQGLGIGD